MSTENNLHSAIIASASGCPRPTSHALMVLPLFPTASPTSPTLIFLSSRNRLILSAICLRMVFISLLSSLEPYSPEATEAISSNETPSASDIDFAVESVGSFASPFTSALIVDRGEPMAAASSACDIPLFSRYRESASPYFIYTPQEVVSARNGAETFHFIYQRS